MCCDGPLLSSVLQQTSSIMALLVHLNMPLFGLSGCNISQIMKLFKIPQAHLVTIFPWKFSLAWWSDHLDCQKRGPMQENKNIGSNNQQKWRRKSIFGESLNLLCFLPNQHTTTTTTTTTGARQYVAGVAVAGKLSTTELWLLRQIPLKIQANTSEIGDHSFEKVTNWSNIVYHSFFCWLFLYKTFP